MIQVSPHMRIMVAVKPVDLRKGIDGLTALVRDYFRLDPMNGTVFVFTNRTRSLLRLLFYDSQGFWICTKRLSSGRWPWWPKGSGSDSLVTPLPAHEMQILIWGGSPEGVNIVKPWRHITPSELLPDEDGELPRN